MKKNLFCFFAFVFVVALHGEGFASPTISDLTVTPIEPLGLAIDYKISGAAEDDADGYYLSVSMNANGTTYFARSLFGATKCTNGAHRVYWNAAKEGFELGEANLNVTVAYKRVPLYCVIGLSSGSVTYMDNPPSEGFNTIEYKTRKIVLKRVNPGTFIMGEDQTNEAHRVTLTKPFYLGLFEVTQGQWMRVTGSDPCSGSRFGDGSTNPVEYVSYDMIRGSSEGSKWPAANSVDSTSFMGRLRASTGINFDLPTEAQWEYACRAGTTTKFSYVDNGDGPYMWWYWNSSNSSHEVGTTKANPWGFYDMHGNVGEYCLDWYGTLAYGMDPRGASSGSYRAVRGSAWYYADERYFTSYWRSNREPSSTGFYLSEKEHYGLCGFRLSLSLQ